MVTNQDGESADVDLKPRLKTKHILPDLSVGDAQHPDPLDQYSWPDLRSIIYDESEPRSAL